MTEIESLCREAGISLSQLAHTAKVPLPVLESYLAGATPPHEYADMLTVMPTAIRLVMLLRQKPRPMRRRRQAARK